MNESIITAQELMLRINQHIDQERQTRVYSPLLYEEIRKALSEMAGITTQAMEVTTATSSIDAFRYMMGVDPINVPEEPKRVPSKAAIV